MISDDLHEYGYAHCKGIFDESVIRDLHNEVKKVFSIQMDRLGIEHEPLDDLERFEKGVFDFFERDLASFVNTGKQIQHLISLHRLSLDEIITEKLKEIGLEHPNISTRPVLFFNHPLLAKEKVYHTVFPHQDWRSMQGSLDSIVVWVPLTDIDKSMGALEIIPKSHKWGLVATKMEKGFGRVDLSDEQREQFVTVEVKTGDALFFSSFLVHQSGNNVSSRIRWSTHWRYNNLCETQFVERGYPHPYIYKPTEELITPDFPKKDLLSNLFK